MRSSVLLQYPCLHGEEAIENLYNFVKALEKNNKDLTKTQIKSLKKIAEKLIASIEAEIRGEPQIKRAEVTSCEVLLR